MKRPLLIIIVCLAAAASRGEIGIDGATPYIQDFNSLAMPGVTNVPWANDSTLPGWSLFRQPAPGTPATVYNAGAGGAYWLGGFYSFGNTGSSERGLGVVAGWGGFGNPPTGAVAGWLAVALMNQSGSTISSVSVHYDGEEWYNGGTGLPQTLTMQWGIGNSFTSVSSWDNAGSAFDFSSPVNGTGGGSLDGNTIGLVAGIGGTMDLVGWDNGDTLWIRWAVNYYGWSGDALAIDNFSFSAGTVPEPSALCLGLAGAASLLVFRRWRASKCQARASITHHY